MWNLLTYNRYVCIIELGIIKSVFFGTNIERGINIFNIFSKFAQKTREFMSKLKEQTNIKIEFVDERLSSLMAEEMLKETERDWKKRKEKLDAGAASIILQDYLDGIR